MGLGRLRNSATETGKEKKKKQETRGEKQSPVKKNLTVTVDNAEQREVETDSFYTFPETEIEER